MYLFDMLFSPWIPKYRECEIVSLNMELPNWFCLSFWAKFVGTNEPALRLLVSILLGYPIALIFRQYLHQKPKLLRHLFCFLTGLSIGYFNFGSSIWHCMITVLGTYIIARTIRGRPGLIANWIWNLGYLCAGYFFTETTDYDILWTMPQCVLCLRMIGFAFDVYDSFFVPIQNRSVYSIKNNVNMFPNVLEIYGYAFFPASFLIGPQFPIARYIQFVENSFDQSFYNKRPPSTMYALKTFVFGLIYLLISQVGSTWLPTDYLLSTDFIDSYLVVKLFYLGVWGRCTLYKYMSCWLLTEGACALFGLTFNGRDPDNPDEFTWNGCQNVDIIVFELCNEFTHYIASFNCNTNTWVAEYVYKRLKYMDNKLLSQTAALMFLAVWHGFHSGYYVTFLLEFIVLYYERDFYQTLKERPHLLRALRCKYPRYVCLFFKRIYTFVFMGFCLLPFVFRVFDQYLQAFGNVRYCGIVFFCCWPLYKPIVRLTLKVMEFIVMYEITWGKDKNKIVEIEETTTCENQEPQGHSGSRVPHRHIVYYDNPTETETITQPSEDDSNTETIEAIEASEEIMPSEPVIHEFEPNSKVRYRGESFAQTLERLKRELRRGLIEDAMFLKQRREKLKSENHHIYVNLDRFVNTEPPKQTEKTHVYREYWRKMFLKNNGGDSNSTTSTAQIPSQRRSIVLREQDYIALEEKISQEIENLGMSNTRVIFERPSSDNVLFAMSSGSIQPISLETVSLATIDDDSRSTKLGLERIISSTTLLEVEKLKAVVVPKTRSEEFNSELEIQTTEFESLPEIPSYRR